jgi:dTDP-4-dehydrorhamnose reductase
MRVIVLGAAGMLGHKSLQRLRTEDGIAGTIRDQFPGAALSQRLPDIRFYANVQANDLSSVERAIDDWQAKFVLNCIGIIKQQKTAADALTSIATNALFPHQLAQITASRGAKLFHFSADCVFSGHRGNYVEDDFPDPVDLYGQTKFLGEVVASNVLTLRLSIVGRALSGNLG